MTKADIISKVAAAADLTVAAAENAVKATFDVIAEALSNGEKVQLIGFGTFEVKDRAAREGRNPATGETLHIPASKVPSFKAGDKLKKACNN